MSEAERRGFRTHVTFKTGRFTLTELGEGALPYDQPYGGDLAHWLIEHLPRYGVAVDKDPCQEDWGWVVFVRLDGMKFWIGMGPMLGAGSDVWRLFVHHDFLAVLQRFTKRGQRGLLGVANALDRLLKDSDGVTTVHWFFEDANWERDDGWGETPESTCAGTRPAS